jgi:hypothetical protein
MGSDMCGGNLTSKAYSARRNLLLQWHEILSPELTRLARRPLRYRSPDQGDRKAAGARIFFRPSGQLLAGPQPKMHNIGERLNGKRSGD